MLQSTGTRLLPQLAHAMVAAPERERIHRFWLGLSQRNSSPSDFSGNSAPWPPLKTPAVFFIPSPLDCHLHQSQLCPPVHNSPFSSTFCCHVLGFQGKLKSAAARTCHRKHKENSRGQVPKDGREIYRSLLLISGCIWLGNKRIFLQISA